MLWSMVHKIYNQNFHHCFIRFYKKFMLDFQFQPCTYKYSNNGWCLCWPRREDDTLHKPNQNKMFKLGLLASPQFACKMILSKHFHTDVKHLVKINKSHENIFQHLFWSRGLLFLLHALQWVVQYLQHHQSQEVQEWQRQMKNLWLTVVHHK